MSNVIAFPRSAKAPTPRRPREAQAQTLFLHVKRATLILHLSGAPVAAQAGQATTR